MAFHRRNRKAFTLIEVLLVIAILAVLAGVGAVIFSGIQERANKDTTKLAVDNVGKLIEIYKTSVGHYPTEEEGGLQALVTAPAADEKVKERWAGPYCKPEAFQDAWHNKLNYRLDDVQTGDTTMKVARIWSMGPNGQDEQGEGDDIKNWSTETQTK